MLDFSYIAQQKGVDQQWFWPNCNSTGVCWYTWVKPRGCNYIHIFLLGGGGAGGAGAVGAASTAGGGGSGGSAAQSIMMFPAWALPDVLYISVGDGGTGGAGAGGAGIISYVSLLNSSAVNYLLMRADPGGGGGIGGAGTGGAAGAAGAVAVIGATPLAALGTQFAGIAATTNVNLVGQAGIIGGAAVAGGTQTLPVTGLVVTGGTGGGGLPAISTSGSAGGAFVVPAGAVFPPNAAGAGGTITPTAGLPGTSWASINVVSKLMYFYGGTGGGSSGMSASAGVGGGDGGAAGPGCGGGGGGAAFTGFVAGKGGNGGPGLCVITAW